jgi:uncharacterized protein (TIRG00374 family)
MASLPFAVTFHYRGAVGAIQCATRVQTTGLLAPRCRWNPRRRFLSQAMRRVFILLIKLSVSGLLLYLALNGVDIGTVAGRLRDIDPRWAAVLLLAPLTQNFLASLRWQAILRQCGANFPLGQLFRYGMAALFFNQTLPSGLAGDGVRIWLAGKQIDWRAATYSVLIDRVVGVVALAVLVTACLPWSMQLVRNPVGRTALLLIGLGSIAAGIVFVSLSWQRLRFLQRWRLTRHLAATATVTAAILRSPAAVSGIFGLSFLNHFVTVVMAWCAARAVGAQLPLLYALFLVLPVILIAIVPVSIAGWGIREGAMVAAFGYAGLTPSDGLIVSLLYGAGNLAIGALGGLVWALSDKPREDLPAALTGDDRRETSR